MITLASKSIPVYGMYDVVVAGGGTAGSVAAVSAAREGLSVLLIEKAGMLGGMQSRGLVNPMMYNPMPVSILDALPSIVQEMHKRLEKKGQYDFIDGCIYFNSIGIAMVQEELAMENGVEVLYHTTLVDVVRDANVLQYVVISNKNGLSAVGAKIFVDCTGDADLCFLAKVPYSSGNSQGFNQNITLRFEMANVDIPKYREFEDRMREAYGVAYMETFMRQKYEEGYPENLEKMGFQNFVVPGKPGVLSFNCPTLGRAVNVIDAKYMSRQQTAGRVAIHKLADFAIRFVPGFEKAYVGTIASELGIRESRRIVAEYVLTKEDVHRYRKFPDGIAATGYPMDAHGEPGYGENADDYDQEVRLKYYEVPYRSLVPVGIDNVLCAGRCAGFDFLAQSTARIQHTCQFMGEAAGIACKLAVEGNIPLREVDGKVIRHRLAEYGKLAFFEK